MTRGQDLITSQQGQTTPIVTRAGLAGGIGSVRGEMLHQHVVPNEGLVYDVSHDPHLTPGGQPNMNAINLEARRNFLRFLAGSPLLAAARLPSALCDEIDPETSNLISSAKDAINVFDFESVAEYELPPAHWGYLKTGVDDDGTVFSVF